MKIPFHGLLSLAVVTTACAAAPSRGSDQDAGAGSDPDAGAGSNQDSGSGSDPSPGSGSDPSSGAGGAIGFTATYQGQAANATTCTTSFAITGQEPSASDANPVFLYMVGTTENATNASATAAVAAMAAKGYVAATIAYDSASFNNCGVIQGKAKCIFDPNSQTSAVQTLCSRAKADCTKGIVVGGFSQGAVIATQARNTDPRVRAAWGMGDGVSYSTFNLSSCQADGNRALPSASLRVTNGQQDQFVGGGLGLTPGTIANVRSQSQTLTGFNCGANATSCLQPNGSGWIIVQDGQVTDGTADHCFMRAAGNLCAGSQDALDTSWKSGTADWELGASLSFLDSFVTH